MIGAGDGARIGFVYSYKRLGFCTPTSLPRRDRQTSCALSLEHRVFVETTKLTPLLAGLYFGLYQCAALFCFLDSIGPLLPPPRFRPLLFVVSRAPVFLPVWLVCRAFPGSVVKMAVSRYLARVPAHPAYSQHQHRWPPQGEKRAQSQQMQVHNRNNYCCVVMPAARRYTCTPSG